MAMVSKRILIAVSGMSPQIITETLYGLLHREGSQWLPEEIHLITTSGSREQARLQLLGEGGYFQQFLQDYGIANAIKFDLATIHVIKGSDGNELDDLRTPQDNEAAANFITETVRHFTNEPNTELHVSLAGGRKTMGFYIGYALSLFGRHQDRLSHVLVDAPYESLSGFYYPTPKTKSIPCKDGKTMLDASKARVWLAEIPFVRLRHFLPEASLLNANSFRDTVDLVELAMQSPCMQVLDKEHAISIYGRKIKFPPREFAFYRWFVGRCLDGKDALEPPGKEGEGNTVIGREYLACFKALKCEMDDIEKTEKALRNGMDRNYFDSIKSRVKSILEKALGEKGARPYQIQTVGKRSKSRFALLLNADEITLRK
jgi:CRISPR-associated protein (TIGR02584 family)